MTKPKKNKEDPEVFYLDPDWDPSTEEVDRFPPCPGKLPPTSKEYHALTIEELCSFELEREKRSKKE